MSSRQRDPLQIGILATVAIGTERAHSSAVLVFLGCAILADFIVLAGPGVTTVSRRTWTAPQNLYQIVACTHNSAAMWLCSRRSVVRRQPWATVEGKQRGVSKAESSILGNDVAPPAPGRRPCRPVHCATASSLQMQLIINVSRYQPDPSIWHAGNGLQRLAASLPIHSAANARKVHWSGLCLVVRSQSSA